MAFPSPMTAWQTHSNPHARRALGSELVPPAGVEPATPTLGKSCSILLSYGGSGGAVYPLAAGPSMLTTGLVRAWAASSARWKA